MIPSVGQKVVFTKEFRAKLSRMGFIPVAVEAEWTVFEIQDSLAHGFLEVCLFRSDHPHPFIFSMKACDGTFKRTGIIALELAKTDPNHPDTCKRCGRSGDVVRTACICRQCGGVIWGL